MLDSALKQKEDLFSRLFVEGVDATKAYSRVYDTSGMQSQTIRKRAHELRNSPRVVKRIKQLRQDLAKMHNITVDKLLAELEEARNIALTAAKPQSAAAVAATMGKAKLAGLDKQIIEHQVQQPTSYTINLIQAIKHDAD